MNGHAARRLAVWLCVTALICIASLVAPSLIPHDPIATDLMSVNIGPCAEYPLGTDSVGRCIACRVITGLHTTLFSAFAVVLLAFSIGTVLGAVSGYVGGALDAVLMRVTDAFMAFPSLVLSIAVAGLLGGGLTNAIIALAIPDWTKYARLARSQVLAMKGRTFVRAETIGGLPSALIAVKHVLPNILPSLVSMACLDVGGMMLNLAGLSFLGLGANPPAPELGSMVNQASATFQLAPWAVFAPGAAILIVVMVLNMFGDSVNDFLNAHARGSLKHRSRRGKPVKSTRGELA